MAETNNALERRFANDLQTLGDLVQDDSWNEDLYKSLAGVNWFHDGGHVSLSWKRAEDFVNEIRAKHGQPPLALAQTGGEGDVADRVANALSGLGWTPKPLDTSRHDDAHLQGATDTQRRTGGEPPAWERQAHAEADRNRM
jgi:hypothetical protein